jgi:CheY-like chemotaxis protein
MKSVVVIDDDIDVRDVIAFAVGNDGFDVTSYSNGREALEVLLKTPQENLPGLIIVDYLMPEMDGLTFINEINAKHSKHLGHVALAFSSAMGSVEPQIISKNEIIYLHKPMELEELLKIVRKFCS